MYYLDTVKYKATLCFNLLYIVFYIGLLTKANLAKTKDAKLLGFHVRVMLAGLPIKDSVAMPNCVAILFLVFYHIDV